MADIVFAGFGGQGVLTAGKIMITIAAEKGKNITWTSSYGAAMRGGTANCSIVISDEEIGSPYPTKLDILVAMNEPSLDKFVDTVKDGGYIIANKSLISDRSYPDGVNVIAVEATDIANDMGNGRAANLCMLGALIKGTEMFAFEEFRNDLEAYFSHKHIPTEKNVACYKAGYEKAYKI